jgi:hypothetical protein
MVGGMNNMEAEVDWKADAKVAVLIWLESGFGAATCL